MCQTKSVDKLKTHFMFHDFFFGKSRHLWHNVEKNYGTAGQATDDNITGRMRPAFRVTKTTDTPSEYVILTGFQRQNWLRERAQMLHYTYITWLVFGTWRTRARAGVCVCVWRKTWLCQTNPQAIPSRNISHFGTIRWRHLHEIGSAKDRPFFYYY